jgi:hypothetical protein
MMASARPAVRLSQQARAAQSSSSALHPHVTQLAASSGSGEALPSTIQVALEGSLGVSLRGVRVHTDARSAAIAAGMGARAFTYGTHVFLGPRERATDLRLMAHEVTHVVQQQGKPVIQMCCAGCCGTTATGDTFEREASHAAMAVTSGVPFTVQGRTGGAQVQKEDGGQEDEGLLTRMLWGLLEEISPEFTQMLREIMRQGMIEWLKTKINSAVESIFNTLASPVREVTGVVASLSSHFNNLLAWMRDAAARIARGDCGAITEAAEKIQQVFEGLAAPVIDRIKHLADRVKGFFTGLWDRFGAPAWEFLRNVGGQAWEKIQQFGRWIWEKTARVRSTLASAWRWIKNRLGIGEGEEGQNGLLQWVQRKAATAWDWIKERLEPIKRPLMVVGGILVMLSPAGPVIAIGAAVGGLMVGIRWIRQHMSRPNGVVEQRNAFEHTIIPAIMGAVGRVTSALQGVANSITDKLNGVMAGLGNAVGAVAGSIFRFAVSIFQWIADQFRALVAWGNEKLMGLVEWVRGALESLRVFLQPILNVLGQIGRVVGDIMRLPFLIAGRLWNMIPACIRDPFINFFIPLILSRIPLFRELVSTPEAWAQTRAGVMTIIRQIFRDHDLIGAMKGVFRLLLRALAVPVELAGRVLAKAATAWDAVLEHPIQFLKNILRAMGLGFRRFFGNILSHLLFGVSGWIFAELRDVGVTPPSSWTDLRAVFGFVLSVLGITVDHIFELLGRRLSPERVQQLRRAYNFLTGAWEWVKVAIAEGPAGIWRMLVERLRDLGSAVLRAAVDWIIDRIVTRVTARLLSMLDPTGIMAVVNALVSLYQAIQTVVRYARQILEIVNRVLDTIINIASGVIGPAAEMMEAAMRGAMPVIIAFLANQAGLSGLGARMREIITNIRERVDNALLWIIDLAIRAMQALMRMLGLGGQQPGQAGAARRDIDKPLSIGPERHTLRGHIENGRVSILMASNGFADFQVRVDELSQNFRRYYRETNQETIAAALSSRIFALERKKRTIIENADAAPNDTAKSAILDTGLIALVSDFDQIVNEFVIGGVGVGGTVRVNMTVLFMNRVSATVTHVMERSYGTGVFGIKIAYSDPQGPMTTFVSYKDFGTRWTIPAVPGFVAFSTGGSHLTPSDCVVTIDEPHLNSGTGTSAIPPADAALMGFDSKWSLKGHLVARVFGGPGGFTSGNIVPMTHAANHTGAGMPGIENTVRDDIRINKAVYHYRVSPVFNLSKQKPPVKVQVYANRLFPSPGKPPSVPSATPYEVDNT